MRNHTPTPWTCYPEDLRGGRCWTVARPGQDGDAISIWDEDNGEVDAAFICEAVNRHEALLRRVAALEMIIREELPPLSCGCDANRMLVEDIHAAVGNVGKQP